MHDLNKSIRVNNASRQQQQPGGMGPPPGSMGYGPPPGPPGGARGEDPAAQARFDRRPTPGRSADTAPFF